VPTARQPALSLLVVHWHAEEDLARLLAAVPADPRFELVVVDNGAAGPLPSRADVLLVRAAGNLGFAGGANLAAMLASAPLLLLLNPDARPAADALEALLEGFAALPEAAGLAPRLVGEDGRTQTGWQLRALPRPRQLLLHTLFRDATRGNDAEPPAGAIVEQPAAAALALRREAWERLGGFDPTFHPAWFEDVDFARRLRAAGTTLHYWPAATFQHRLGGSVAPLGYARFLWCYSRNLCRYLAKHHGRGWAAAARTLLVAGVLLRTVALPLRRPRRARSRASAALALAGTGIGALTAWRLPRWLASAEGAP
jgi:GT2 family glycosyltransferase